MSSPTATDDALVGNVVTPEKNLKLKEEDEKEAAMQDVSVHAAAAAAARSQDPNPDTRTSTSTSTSTESSNEDNTDNDNVAKAMSLNVAYESLESIRKMNLQLEFEDDQIDVTQCIPCLQALKKWKDQEQSTIGAAQAAEEAAIAAITQNKQRGWRLQKLAATTRSRLQQRRTDSLAPTPSKPGMPPCLGCGTSICTKHRSKDFQKQNIVICNECSKLFSLEFLVNSLTLPKAHATMEDPTSMDGHDDEYHNQNSVEIDGNVDNSTSDDNSTTAVNETATTATDEEDLDDDDDGDGDDDGESITTQQQEDLLVRHQQQQKKMMNYILEVYDRTLLILQYSIPYIDEIALELEKMKARHNHIGLGSSATGIASGVMGVAAAATILTPVGPPLLIASMLFGGSATAASAGSEAVNYKSEPNKMADKIMALHAIVTNIACVPATLDHMTTAIELGGEEVEEKEDVDEQAPGNGNNEEHVVVQQEEEGSSNNMEQDNNANQTNEEQTPQDPEERKEKDEEHTSTNTSTRSITTSASTVDNKPPASSPTSSDKHDKALHWRRVTLNAVKPLTAGALSAISIVTEAHEMNATLKRIQNGNPCEKADMLRQIQKEMKYNFPTTNDMAQLLQQRCR